MSNKAAKPNPKKLCKRLFVRNNLLITFKNILKLQKITSKHRRFKLLLRCLLGGAGPGIGIIVQRNLGVHKILVREIWFDLPPPKRAQNKKKLYKSVENPQIDFFQGGATQLYGQNDFEGHLGIYEL